MTLHGDDPHIHIRNSIDELEVELCAPRLVAAAGEAVDAYRDGGATLGEALERLAGIGALAERFMLRAWADILACRINEVTL